MPPVDYSNLLINFSWLTKFVGRNGYDLNQNFENFRNFLSQNCEILQPCVLYKFRVLIVICLHFIIRQRGFPLENTKLFLAPFRVFACPVKPLFMFNRGAFVINFPL